MDVQCTDKYRRLNRYATSLYGDGLSISSMAVGE
jgi:hypothetical protein